MTLTMLQHEKPVSNFRVLQHKPYLKDNDGPATPKGSGIEQRNVDSPQYFFVVDEEKCKQNTQINHQEHESAQSGRSTFRRKDSSQADEEKQIALEAMLDLMEWNKKLPDVTSPIPSETSPRSIYGDRELQECAADNIISVHYSPSTDASTPDCSRLDSDPLSKYAPIDLLEKDVYTVRALSLDDSEEVLRKWRRATDQSGLMVFDDSTLAYIVQEAVEPEVPVWVQNDPSPPDDVCWCLKIFGICTEPTRKANPTPVQYSYDHRYQYDGPPLYGPF
mmetsp:Transcript_47511/g.148649  ORF Transcript_47511/g.148649 Transcript_47511/m.148649 type:complete len:277 (-) Transcript_47511:2216-3046(-)